MSIPKEVYIVFFVVVFAIAGFYLFSPTPNKTTLTTYPTRFPKLYELLAHILSHDVTTVIYPAIYSDFVINTVIRRNGGEVEILQSVYALSSVGKLPENKWLYIDLSVTAFETLFKQITEGEYVRVQVGYMLAEQYDLGNARILTLTQSQLVSALSKLQYKLPKALNYI